MYEEYNPNLNDFIQSKYTEWCQTQDNTIIGTIIYNLADRNYSIDHFVEKYSEPTILSNRVVYDRIADRKFYILLQESDISIYYNKEFTINSRDILKNVLKYASHKYVGKLFMHDHSRMDYASLLNIYNTNWLYYASFSNIWKRRIREYDGHIDHDNKNVIFEDDDKNDLFNDKYYYDTDEQYLDIKHKNIGAGNETQWTWQDFYEKYKHS